MESYMFSDNPIVDRWCKAIYKGYIFLFWMTAMTINGIDIETIQLRSMQVFNYMQSLEIQSTEENKPLVATRGLN
jgi:hypothetical protein